ncbi:TNT domain-containing protein [Nocardia brasiliensis]|uniref:TNT domain-containing protein n=1 Tax=Nocardia brasiliensis TaxID=37326 RepID=UPI00142E2553|nr:TNT domain-containing protein [Nocardia brasiliensis]
MDATTDSGASRNGLMALLALTGAAAFVAGAPLGRSRPSTPSSALGGMVKQANSKPQADFEGGGGKGTTGQSSSMGTLGLLTGVDPMPQQQPGVGGLPDVIDIVNEGTPAPGQSRTLPSGTGLQTNPGGTSTEWSPTGGQSFTTERTSPRPSQPSQQSSITPQQLTGVEPMPQQQQGPMDLLDVLALTKHGPIEPNTTTELPSGYTIENTTSSTENGVTVSTNTYRYPGTDPTTRTEYTRTFNEPFNGEGTSYDATVDEQGNLISVTVHGSKTIQEITFNPDHSYTVTGTDGSTQRFDPTGKPLDSPPTGLEDPKSQATKDWLREGWHTATSLNRFIQNLQGVHGVEGLQDDAEILGNAATSYAEWTLENQNSPNANAELLTTFGRHLLRYDDLVRYGPQYWQQKMGLDIGTAIIGGEAAIPARPFLRGGEELAEGVGRGAVPPKGGSARPGSGAIGNNPPPITIRNLPETDALPPYAQPRPDLIDPNVPTGIIPPDYMPYGDTLTPEEFAQKYWDPSVPAPDYAPDKPGAWKYPDENGFRLDPSGNPIIFDRNYVPPPGTEFDRFGSEFGRYLAPKGSGFGERSLPPNSLQEPYYTYVVTDVPLPDGWRLELGPVAPGFEQQGNGIQIFIVPPVDYNEGPVLAYLRKEGYLR